MPKKTTGKGAARITAQHKKAARKTRKKTPSLAQARKKRMTERRKTAWPLH